MNNNHKMITHNPVERTGNMLAYYPQPAAEPIQTSIEEILSLLEPIDYTRYGIIKAAKALS